MKTNKTKHQLLTAAKARRSPQSALMLLLVLVSYGNANAKFPPRDPYDERHRSDGRDLGRRPRPNLPRPTPKSPEQSCKREGSIIDCQNQTLAESIPITGTPFSLHYTSARAWGYAPRRLMDVQLTGPILPPELQMIRLEIEGGTRSEFARPTVNQRTTITIPEQFIDGNIWVGYVYPALRGYRADASAFPFHLRTVLAPTR